MVQLRWQPGASSGDVRPSCWEPVLWAVLGPSALGRGNSASRVLTLAAGGEGGEEGSLAQLPGSLS